MTEFSAVRDPAVGGPEIFNLWPDWTLTLDDVRVVVNPSPDRENWVIIDFTFTPLRSKQTKRLRGVDEWLSEKYLDITLQDSAGSEFDGRVYDEWVAGSTGLARGRYELAGLAAPDTTGWEPGNLEWMRIRFASTRHREPEREFAVLVPHPTIEHREFHDSQTAQAAAEPHQSGFFGFFPKADQPDRG